MQGSKVQDMGEQPRRKAVGNEMDRVGHIRASMLPHQGPDALSPMGTGHVLHDKPVWGFDGGDPAPDRLPSALISMIDPSPCGGSEITRTRRAVGHHR